MKSRRHSPGDKIIVDDAGSPGHDARDKDFQSLLAKVHSNVFQYILCLVPNWANAEDILQETELRLWEEFDRYQPGTNFRAWATSIAHYQVLTFRKKQQRSRLLFSQEVVDALGQQLNEVDWGDSLSDALRSCTEKLPPQSKELLRRCYGKQESMKRVAADTSRSTDAVYKALSRIRQGLRKCIEDTLGE